MAHFRGVILTLRLKTICRIRVTSGLESTTINPGAVDKKSREFDPVALQGKTGAASPQLAAQRGSARLTVSKYALTRCSVAMLLMSAGYDVATAEDGLAALSHLNKTTTDVIVSTCHECLASISPPRSAVGFRGLLS